MSELSAEERASEVPPEILFHRTEEATQIVAIKLSVERARHLANAIDSISSETLCRLVESIVPKE